MPCPLASFPSYIWDGDTHNPDRVARLNEVQPNHQDWDRLVSEVIGTQECVQNLKTNIVVPYSYHWYIEKNQRTGVQTFLGGLSQLVTGGNVNSAANMAVNTSCSRLLFVINSAGDANGTITITGTQYSEETKLLTPNATETITINGVSTDGTANTSLGTPKYDFDNAYLSTHYFTGNCSVSTTDVNLTNVNAYAACIRQKPLLNAFKIASVSVCAQPTNVAAELDLITYTVAEERAEKRVSIHPVDHLQIDGDIPVVRTNNIIHVGRSNVTPWLDTPCYEGFFINLGFYPAGQQYWEQVEITAWVLMRFSQDVIGAL